MDSCNNCKYCHITKELINKKWERYAVCTLWLELNLEGLEDAREPLLQTIRDYEEEGCCEMFTPKEVL